MTKEERHRLLVEWNNTKIDYPNACVHELFEAHARRTPESVAVVFQDRPWTYRELNHRANQIAHRLRAMGVGPEVPVGIFMERSHELLAGLLGILKAGGAYLPLAPTYPRERLIMMLEDCPPRVLLTQSELSGKLPTQGTDVLCVNSNDGSIDAESIENPRSGATPDNRAYIIHTSGSTGRPKGIEICHRSVANLMSSMSQKLGWAERDGFLVITPIAYDASVLEIFLPLVTGARVLLPEEPVSPSRIINLLDRYNVTALQLGPFQWDSLFREGWKGAPGLKMLAGIETVPRELMQRLASLGSPLWNLYGPTETTVWSTLYRHEDGTGPVPIGRPIGNTEIYILDSQLQPVAVGDVGELYIGGAGLARGYFKAPELTAQKFIPHPFSGTPNARLYKTGDAARYLPDGNIEFLGRLDHQFKFRNLRIEPGDIEAALNQHPNVRESAVVAQVDPSGEKRLVAYVASTGPMIEDKELRSFLCAKLPGAMIPSVFPILAALPRTPNGKIDRKVLVDAPGLLEIS